MLFNFDFTKISLGCDQFLFFMEHSWLQSLGPWIQFFVLSVLYGEMCWLFDRSAAFINICWLLL